MTVTLRKKTVQPNLSASQITTIEEQLQKKTRLNFEVSEFRKRQIKTYVSIKNITIKDLFDSFLNEMFGPEKAEESHFIESLTDIEKAVFLEADYFFTENQQLCKKLGADQCLKIAEQVRNGADLATLLGYENVK